MDRKCVIVAFGDILGFGTWSRRAIHSHETKQPFIRDFYKTLELFVMPTDCYVKYLGDGLMVLRELPEDGHKCFQVLAFLREMEVLTKKVVSLVRQCGWPAPDGFRMRVVTGHVDKIFVTDPQHRKRKAAEYVGYPINLAQRLLSIKPDVSCVCHESVVKILGKKAAKLQLKHLGPLEDRRRGVDQEDINGLWTFRFDTKAVRRR